jgi:hypothetical protein
MPCCMSSVPILLTNDITAVQLSLSVVFIASNLYYCTCFLIMLQVIVPLLVSDDEKTLVTCINCLTKVS